MQSTHVFKNVTECAVNGKLYCAVFEPHLTELSFNYLLVEDTLEGSLIQIREHKTLTL